MNTTVIAIVVILVLVGIGVGIYFAVRGDSNNVTISYGANFSVTYGSQRDLDLWGDHMKTATTRWSNVLDETTVIEIYVYTYSGDSGVLAYAGPTSTTNLKGGGQIRFNENANRTTSNFDQVAAHEIGHVLGLGLNVGWTNYIVTVGGNKYLDKTHFVDAYNFYVGTPEYFSSGDTNGIPLTSGEGHFSETVFDKELMTSHAEGYSESHPLTKLTLFVLQRMGWSVNLTNAEDP